MKKAEFPRIFKALCTAGVLGATGCVALAQNAQPQSTPSSAVAAQYPLGVVVGPAGGSAVPTFEQQQYFYRWAKHAGFNIIEHEWLPVAGGWFDWGSVQPAPDRYDWKVYDTTIADAEAAGLTTMMQVLTWYRVPQWLIDKHPDILMQTPLGGGDELSVVKRDEKDDITPLGSLAHPALVEGAAKYAGALARRYANRPGLRGYIIAEERGLPGVWPAGNYYGIDFSPAMRDAYHKYLQQKFGTIENLNRAWGNANRYRKFSDVVWRRGWAHEPQNYRGEWLEYYRTLQKAVANFHNAMAKAIHAADPDARVMVSDFDPLVNRVGHGAYSPLFTEIDEFGYKSYWNDNRMLADYHSGISGGKDAWITNFSEAETTRGGPADQRYMEPRYVRRAFWAAFSHGVKGTFFWTWSPVQFEKMSLLEPLKDGSLETIPAVAEMQKLSDFMGENWKTLSAFKPAAPRVIVHDPNTTFIARHWDFADPKPLREKWQSDTPAAQRYHKIMDVLADESYRFTISTDENIERDLKAPGLQVWSLVGCSHLEERVLKAAQAWVQSGKTLILDEDSGRYNELGKETNALVKYHDRANVTVLKGERWDRDTAQVARIIFDVEQAAPRPYRVTSTPHEAARVSLMNAPNGDELAIIDRRGVGGNLNNRIEVAINWKRPHRSLEIYDPFAARSSWKRSVALTGAQSTQQSTHALEGFQDVLLVLAR